MKRATLIAFMTLLFAPAAVFADPGHPAIVETYEWLHYFTSLRHVAQTAGGIALAVVAYKAVKHFWHARKETIKR